MDEKPDWKLLVWALLTLVGILALYLIWIFNAVWLGMRCE